MKTQNKPSGTFENINTAQRVTFFVVSLITIVSAMESPLVGSSLFGVINILAIALATLAIIGRDPVHALINKAKSISPVSYNEHNFYQGKHV